MKFVVKLYFTLNRCHYTMTSMNVESHYLIDFGIVSKIIICMEIICLSISPSYFDLFVLFSVNLQFLYILTKELFSYSIYTKNTCKKFKHNIRIFVMHYLPDYILIRCLIIY